MFHVYAEKVYPKGSSVGSKRLTSTFQWRASE
jgi:hypothetical protein